MYKKLHNSRIVSMSGRQRLALCSRICLAACGAILLVVTPSYSANPAAASLSEANPKVTWTGSLTPATAGGCGTANNASCDNFKLTIAPPSTAFGPYIVEIRLLPVGDWDLETYDPANRFLKSSGAGPNNVEIVKLYNPAAGTYTIAAAPFAPLAGPDANGDGIPDSYIASAELKKQPPNSSSIAGTESVSFRNYAWPSGTGIKTGEPSIGVNWKTGKVMYAGGGTLRTLRVSFDDSTTPANATWENVSHIWTTSPRAFADPILFTDRETGRTFAGQLEGLTPFSTTSYTDDDGTNWLPSQGSGIASGIDHQTIGGGRLHAPLTRDPNLPSPAYPNGVYYCAQELVAANCALSVDGGQTFGPSVTMYTSECGGLHGHIKVAPDGTVYVPNRGCDGLQGVAVSEDNGMSWKIRTIPGTGSGESDPSVAIATDGTIYLGFQDADGHPKVAVSHDKGQSWVKFANNAPFQEVAAASGIENIAFPAMVAGDAERAAFAFLGTPTAGAMQDSSFTGVWNLFIAYTFDGGQTWTTVNATPNDPVQRGCIWLGGGSVPCRNLLDFMDASIDQTGRVLVGYADGCTGTCVNTNDPNLSRTALATIARQSDGKRLFAAPAPSPTPTPTPPPADSCQSATQVLTDPAGDQQDPVLPQAGPKQLDIRALSAGEDYRYTNSERLAFSLKVDNLNTIPARAVWRVLFDFTPPGGALTTYYVAMKSDANAGISYEYGTQSGNLLTTLGSVEEGSYSSDGIVRLTLALAKVGNATNGYAQAGSTLANVNALTEQATDVVVGTLFSTVDDTSKVSYTVGAKSASCTSAAPPTPPGTATYLKGGMTFSPSYALRAPVASRDGEPSLRVDKQGNAYVAGIRGVPAGVDLWYFDLNPNSPMYDPNMRNPIYRGQPDQFSPDEAMEVGADGGGDVDLAVGFDPASPGQPPYLAFSSLVLANVSTARSTDRGATFTKNPAGTTTGGIPVDDRQWMEFYGKDSVYLLYRTVAPTIAFVQRSNDGGLTYGPARLVGTIGQVGGIDVDQNDGTIYVSGNTGVVAVGIPQSPGMEPLTYTVHNVVGSGKANVFFTVKVANDGTVYVCYSDGKNVFIKYSTDKGTNWSPQIRISDGPDTATSLLPWLETGPVPGSIGVVWYGSTATSNSDNADWKVFFAQSTNITSPNPTVTQAEVSDHLIHGSNISLAGLPLNPTTPSGNRNLIDYFQIGFDPTGAAVIAFTDDHNDFDGHTYVSRQTGGPSVSGGRVAQLSEGVSLPAQSAPGPKPSAESVGGILGSQVTDFRHDTRTSNATIDVDDPFDVVSIKYATEGTASALVLVATMKVSDLSTIPPNGTWRMNFTANAPGAGLSTTGDYNFGLSDRGDQFFLRANTDSTGSQSFVYGTAARRHFVAGGGGGFDYTDKGTADSGSFDAAGDTITMKVSLSKLNSTLAAGRTPIGPGSVLAGLRGSAFASVQGNNARSDSTRGGTVARINSAPTAVLIANPTSGFAPLAVNFDGSGSSDPDPGDMLTYTFDFGDGTAPVTQSGTTIAHTYNNVGKFTASLTVKDSIGFGSNTATVVITVNAPPVAVCYEDDNGHIAYSSGWHLVSSTNASAGHFRLHSGKDATHFASLTLDVPAGQTGTLTYTYAKSTKGGSAEVFIDGISRGTISYLGPNGGMRDPEFKSGGVPYSVKYAGLAPGQHKFELKNLTDSAYIDSICLDSAASNSQPATGPGQTSSNSSSMSGGQQYSSALSVPTSTREVSVLAEASGGLPITLLLVDPTGLTLKTVDSSNGIAVLNAPVANSGLYTIRVVNLSLGPVQVWTVATPLVAR